MSRRGEHVLTAGAIMVALVLLPVQGGIAHESVKGNDSVDGMEIRYDDSTRYNDALSNARLVWNALQLVNIAPDGWDVLEDLQFSDDEDTCTPSVYGVWLPSRTTSSSSCATWTC